MDTTRIDAVIRLFGSGTTRRQALQRLVAGAAVFTASGSLLTVEDATARRKRRKKNKKKTTTPAPMSDAAPPPNPCDGKNWCVDRSQTCGPAGGYGKCLVEASGGNICAELLFQAASCTECEPANCTNCRCVLAAGGGDRCNNGPTGQDFVCVRAV